LKFLTGSYPTDIKTIFQASGESGRADLSRTLFKKCHLLMGHRCAALDRKWIFFEKKQKKPPLAGRFV